MTRLSPLLLATTVGCTTWYAERTADLGVSHRTTTPHFVTVVVAPPGSGLSSSVEPPTALRDAHPSFVACGVPADAVLEARVVVRPGDWPWAVRGLDATPEERCVAEVLSTLPLDDGLWAGAVRILDFAATVEHLRPTAGGVEAAARDRNTCTGHRDRTAEFPAVYRSIGATSTQLHDTGRAFPGAAGAAAAVTCPSALPLTRLELVWRFGALEEVRTTPEVACVEAAARELVEGDPALLSRWSQQPSVDEAAAWDELRCELQVPLRPEAL